MKMKTKIKSKMSRTFSGNFTEAYKKFTMSHMRGHTDPAEAFLSKPLNLCKVALVSTAGAHLKTDEPFDVDTPAGDHTFRITRQKVVDQLLELLTLPSSTQAVYQDNP